MSDALTQHRSLQETLEAEFCPPLDTSLLAALIAELDIPNNEQDSPLETTIQGLRVTLTMLAQQAELDDDLCTQSFNNTRIYSQSASTDESESALGSSWDMSGDAASSSSSSAPYNTLGFHSPLGFLQAAFPHLTPHKLRKTLNDAGANGAEMETIVEGLLSDEYVRELQERGLDDESDAIVDGGDWKIVKKSSGGQNNLPNKETLAFAKGRKKKPRGTTITLVDVRQKQHARPNVPRNGSQPVGDPWIQLTSMATHLATLLPPHPASMFLSYFHSPDYATPAMALRAALTSMPVTPSAEHHSLLYGILDLLCDSPAYENLDSEARTRLLSDAELAIAATNGRSEDALDLVWLLRDLDTDRASSQLEMGVYHSPAPTLSAPSTPIDLSTPLLSPLASPRAQATAATSGLPPPSVVSKVKPPPAPNRVEYDWNTVRPRRPKPPHIHPLALSIPAYNPLNVPRKHKSSGNVVGKGGKGDVGELTSDSERFNEYRRKRSEALLDASRYWRSGNSKSRGGEVAFYFADRAREYQEKSRTLALNLARERVEEKRRMSGTESDTIDLHGSTTSEAVTIVQEVLSEGWSSPTRPLKIITGRGSHSANRVGVLGPAVKSILDADGWNVARWDGGLLVRGRSKHPTHR